MGNVEMSIKWKEEIGIAKYTMEANTWFSYSRKVDFGRKKEFTVKMKNVGVGGYIFRISFTKPPFQFKEDIFFF